MVIGTVATELDPSVSATLAGLGVGRSGKADRAENANFDLGFSLARSPASLASSSLICYSPIIRFGCGVFRRESQTDQIVAPLIICG